MHSKFIVERERGVLLSCHCWLPRKSSALVLIVHGIGEHASRYDKVANALNESGFAVYSFDLRGHGESSGKRGHIGSFKTTIEDIEAVVCRARETVGDIPLFIYGHSMGGGIALSRMVNSKSSTKGYIITSPWLLLVEKKPAALISASRVLRAIIPSFTIPTKLDASLISSDKRVVDLYRNDPLVHGMISAATAIDAIDSAEKVLGIGSIPSPLFLAHGKSDGIVSIDGSRKLGSKGGKAVTYTEMDGAHELHNEPSCFEPLMKGISAFINENLA